MPGETTGPLATGTLPPMSRLAGINVTAEAFVPDGIDVATLSLAAKCAFVPKQHRHHIFDGVDPDTLLHDWAFWARPNQLVPQGAWRYWLILAGRGWGKTRTGAEVVKEWDGPEVRIALVGRTAADVRDTMIEGESGLIALYPDGKKPVYEPSKRRVTLPGGAICTCYSADEPELLRGPQHHKAWADEVAAWRRPEAWDMLMFGLRLGDNPQCVVTTTPKPTKLVKDLVADPLTFLTRGTTYENAGNLAQPFLDEVVKKYEGTRLGRQELYAEILDDNPAALWSGHIIENNRVATMPEFVRVGIGCDPAVTANEKSDETGLIGVGIGEDGCAYVFADASGTYRPEQWAKEVQTLYHASLADIVVGEVNNGGDLVESNVRTADPNINFHQVRATRGKYKRFEPVAALYERGMVKHVGIFPELEQQMTTWDAVSCDWSPDRLDALCWILWALLIDTDPVPDIKWA